MATIHCIVVTPEKTSLEQDATFVVVPMFDGEYGIGLGHTPVIGRLGYGELRLRLATGAVLHYYVDGGFVQVVDNVVSVLTSRLVPAREVNETQVKEHLATAMRRPVPTEEQLQQRDRLVEQARSQLRVAARAK